MKLLSELTAPVLARRAEPSQQSQSAVAVRYDAGVPPLWDRECDVDIPSRVWSAWAPAGAPRAITRPLSATEQHKLTVRKEALEAALRPFNPEIPEEVDDVEREIAGVLSGFRSNRQQEENALAMVEVTRRVLGEFPYWAIGQGCMLIARRRAQLDPPIDPIFGPSDQQIHEVVEEIVKGYRRSLNTAAALLSAPIEIIDSIERPARAEVVKPPAAPAPPMHARTLVADLLAKRQRLERLGASPCPCGCPI